ncbi:MAG: L-2-hydroxyglutarate oxidase [Myxococcota bacterium]
MERRDLVVIGGGIVGLAAARAFATRHPGRSVVVLEKEHDVGAHASGRNSGVLHAGFYYAHDSLKARFSVDGNRMMSRFCDERALPIRRCGKLVVARSARDLPALELLRRRGVDNGVRVESISAADARRIEPRVRTVEQALWSPDTAVVDPARVVSALAADARSLGVEIRTGTAFTGRSGSIVTTPSGPIGAGLVLNCAGAYADQVAAAWGVGGRFTLVPFRGSYVIGAPTAPPLACCVYPVPDLELPFLGVHLTVRVDGRTKIGPTAAPARWREDYGGLRGVRWGEVGAQVRIQTRLLGTNGTFRRHAARELAKHSRTWLVREASHLCDGLSRGAFRTWGRSGIRAQLVDRASGDLVQDFVVDEGERSLHVLNAVSPAFTCSLPFAEHLVDRLDRLGQG